MSKKKIQINIPEPCHKKFAEMIPAKGGSFCDSCEKIIVDFTNMTDNEIANTFIKNKGKICGQFRKDQLNKNIDLIPPPTNSYRGKAASILLSGVLTAGVANAQNNITTPQVIENQQITNEKPQVTKSQKEENTSSNKPKKFKFFITNETEEALIGASIILKGKEIGTTTDIDGTATLDIPSSYLAKNSFTVSVSYIGYITQELVVTKNQFNSNQVFQVILNHREILIGEMIIIGYSRRHPTTLYGTIKNWFYKFKFRKGDRKKNRQNRREERKEKKADRKATQQLKKQSSNKIIQLPIQHFSISIKNISPNPFSDYINLEIYSEVKDDIQISLFNISGQKIYHVTQGMVEGNQNISLNLKNIKLENGEYILHLREKNGQVQSRKIIRISNK